MTQIIVGVDASESSQDAVAFARDLAGATGADVVLATSFRYQPGPSRVAVPHLATYLEEDAQALLEPLREGFDSVRTIAIAGPSPARALQELAEDEGAAIIVIGSSHRGRMGRVFPGSTAMRLAHGSRCAIAVVPRGYRSPGEHRFARIGCAFDASDEAAMALDAAAAAAAALDARLDVIHVFDMVPYDDARIRSAEDVTAIVDEFERGAREDLDEAVGKLPSTIAAESHFIEGAPYEVLADRSQELDMLFAGSRGYGPTRAVLLGSVTHRLLQEASCPVVVLPRGAEPTLPRLFGAPVGDSAGA